MCVAYLPASGTLVYVLEEGALGSTRRVGEGRRGEASTHGQDWDPPESELGGGLVVVVERDWLCGDCFHKILDERELVLVCHRTGQTISVAVHSRDTHNRDEPVTRFPPHPHPIHGRMYRASSHRASLTVASQVLVTLEVRRRRRLP